MLAVDLTPHIATRTTRDPAMAETLGSIQHLCLQGLTSHVHGLSWEKAAGIWALCTAANEEVSGAPIARSLGQPRGFRQPAHQQELPLKIQLQ